MVKCHYCNVEGHKSNVCPIKKIVTFVDAMDDDDDAEIEPNEECEEHTINGYCDETLSL